MLRRTKEGDRRLRNKYSSKVFTKKKEISSQKNQFSGSYSRSMCPLSMVKIGDKQMPVDKLPNNIKRLLLENGHNTNLPLVLPSLKVKEEEEVEEEEIVVQATITPPPPPPPTPPAKLMQEIDKDLLAWFGFVEPIPNNTCWLSKGKEYYRKKTRNSQYSRSFSDREPKLIPVWLKKRPKSVLELLSNTKKYASSPPVLDCVTKKYLKTNVRETLYYDKFQNSGTFGLATLNGNLRRMPFSKSRIEGKPYGLSLRQLTVSSSLRANQVNTEDLHHRLYIMPVYLSDLCIKTLISTTELIKHYDKVVVNNDYKPVGLRKDLERDPELIRFYAYWNRSKFNHWVKSGVMYKQPSAVVLYEQWLFKTRCLNDDSRILDRVLEKSNVLNNKDLVGRKYIEVLTVKPSRVPLRAPSAGSSSATVRSTS